MNNLSTFDDCDCICHYPEGQHLGCYPYCVQCGQPVDISHPLPENKVENETFIGYCDGGSRGNPGPSGYGAVIEDAHGRVLAELSAFLGIQTNNYAEYSGLLAILEWCIRNNVKNLLTISDSKLLVCQINGQYRVKSVNLRLLWEKARKYITKFDQFEIRHTSRGNNKKADWLANLAMDSLIENKVEKVRPKDHFEASNI